MASKEIPTETLRTLYVERNLTDKEIAQMHGVSDVSVSKWRRKAGIETKSQLARLGHETGCLEFDTLTPANLASMYSSMGQQAIAKKFGVSKPTVRSRLKKFGIRSISKTERSTSRVELTLEQKEACIGVMLGAHGLSFSVPDGVMAPPSLRNIHKELLDDLGVQRSHLDGNLIGWAKQFGLDSAGPRGWIP
jgi:transposase-like protein